MGRPWYGLNSTAGSVIINHGLVCGRTKIWCLCNIKTLLFVLPDSCVVFAKVLLFASSFVSV